MRRLLLPALFGLLLVAFQAPELGPTHLPPPLRLHVPFESVWKAVSETLEERQETVAQEDRAQGRVLTQSREFSSGPLTESHIAKIGQKQKLLDGVWLRVEYQYDIGLSLISDKETVLTVDANIRAREREYLGGEKWVQIRSNGRLESELLTSIGRRLFGQSFSLAEPKKGFWERDPGFIPEADLRPSIVGPERKRP